MSSLSIFFALILTLFIIGKVKHYCQHSIESSSHPYLWVPNTSPLCLIPNNISTDAKEKLMEYIREQKR